MKKALLLISMLLMTITSAMARDGYATRYTTTYETWDRSFSSHYTYREEVYTSCGYYTCYEDYSRTSTVYVEETIIEHGEYAGYTTVNVYRDRKYKNKYVTYYTHNGRVVRRHYHRPHRVIRNRTYVHRHYHTVNYVYIDQFTAEIILGMKFVELGAHVLSACDSDDTACIMLGLASSVSGSLISISASEREAERTALQRRIEGYDKELDDEILDESFDEDLELE